jgi:hypothetical protein
VTARLLTEAQLRQIEGDPAATQSPWAAAAIDALIANVRMTRAALNSARSSLGDTTQGVYAAVNEALAAINAVVEEE